MKLSELLIIGYCSIPVVFFLITVVRYVGIFLGAWQ